MKFITFTPSTFDECQMPGVSTAPYRPLVHPHNRFTTPGDAENAARLAQSAYQMGMDEARLEIAQTLDKLIKPARRSS